ERGFCNKCGSSLFWQMHTWDTTSIMVGSFDEDVQLPVSFQAFMKDRKSYYTPDNTIPSYETYPKDD
ncbi:MAG: GFA family protein, partial [Sneathiella sp.]|nr:GFA family protein [Sneathiella sp.]